MNDPANATSWNHPSFTRPRATFSAEEATRIATCMHDMDHMPEPPVDEEERICHADFERMGLSPRDLDDLIAHTGAARDAGGCISEADASAAVAPLRMPDYEEMERDGHGGMREMMEGEMRYDLGRTPAVIDIGGIRRRKLMLYTDAQVNFRKLMGERDAVAAVQCDVDGDNFLEPLEHGRSAPTDPRIELGMEDRRLIETGLMPWELTMEEAKTRMRDAQTNGQRQMARYTGGLEIAAAAERAAPSVDQRDRHMPAEEAKSDGRCQRALAHGSCVGCSSGQYTATFKDGTSGDVLCDGETAGGGWMLMLTHTDVIQQYPGNSDSPLAQDLNVDTPNVETGYSRNWEALVETPLRRRRVLFLFWTKARCSSRPV